MNKDFYLNGIKSKMFESKMDEFVFDEGTTLKLWYLGDVVDNVLGWIYISQNNELCIAVIIEGENDVCIDPLVDFDIDGIKMIYNVFMEQFSKRIK